MKKFLSEQLQAFNHKSGEDKYNTHWGSMLDFIHGGANPKDRRGHLPGAGAEDSDEGSVEDPKDGMEYLQM